MTKRVQSSYVFKFNVPMDIQQEPAETNAIQSYSDKSITVQGIEYNTSTLITASHIIVNWPVHAIQDLSLDHFSEILASSPEIILIGHNQLSTLPLPQFIQAMSAKRIGVECMSIGAACRTFNILLGEGRKVVLGFIDTYCSLLANQALRIE